jgi:hypothetical protein
MAKSKSAKYYAANPEARAKKQAYDKKHNAKPEERAKRAELNREARKRGVYGKREEMGKDLSHTKSGDLVLESTSRNRARNGAKKGKSRSARRTDTKK